MHGTKGLFHLWMYGTIITWFTNHNHIAKSKTRLLAKCNASRRQIVNFFRNFSQYRLKKGENVQLMSNKGVHGAIVHLTKLHAWNLHGKDEYISQTRENSFGTLPQNSTRFHLNVIFFKSICIYTLYNVIDYVTLSFSTPLISHLFV